MTAIIAVIYIIAYTLGIACISIQLLCYFKKMESRESLFFSFSFLLLILTFSFSELEDYFSEGFIVWNERMKSLLFVFLGLTTPVNVHTERIFKYAGLVNRTLHIISGSLVVLFIISVALKWDALFTGIALVFLNISISYSMGLILVAKPSILVKHREKLEKLTSIIFFSILILFLLAMFLLNRQAFSESLDSFWPMILPLFFIFLVTMKLVDDIKRISMFTFKNDLKIDKIEYYKISQREAEVLDLLIKGKSYTTIGEELYISLPTVKTHISNIYRKFDVNNKVELINILNDT